jgi:hypothetical protein
MFTESHKDLLFHLLIKYFLIFGTELSSLYLSQTLRHCGAATRGGAGGAGGGGSNSSVGAGEGLENHLRSHALQGNWKKFKNCLKTFMR